VTVRLWKQWNLSPLVVSDVTTQQSPKTPTQVQVGPITPSSMCLSPQSAVCPQIQRGTRERNKVTERERKREKERETEAQAYCSPLPELKMDSRMNASMAVSRDCDCSPPSDTWDSFILVGHSDGATNTPPPPPSRKGRVGRKRRRRMSEWVGGGAICPSYYARVQKGRGGWLKMDHHHHHLPRGERRANGALLQVPRKRGS